MTIHLFEQMVLAAQLHLLQACRQSSNTAVAEMMLH